jgi:hypothetical protein
VRVQHTWCHQLSGGWCVPVWLQSVLVLLQPAALLRLACWFCEWFTHFWVTTNPMPDASQRVHTIEGGKQCETQGHATLERGGGVVLAEMAGGLSQRRARWEA